MHYLCIVDYRSYRIRLGNIRFSNQIVYHLALIDFSSRLFYFSDLSRNLCGPCCPAHFGPWGQGFGALFFALSVPTGPARVHLPAACHLACASRPVPCTARAPPAHWSPELWRHSSEGLTRQTLTLNLNGKPSNPLIPCAIESRSELFVSALGRIAI
jgi:hypothetical protein